MTLPQDDPAARRAAIAEELDSNRSATLWALTLLGVIVSPVLILGFAWFGSNLVAVFFVSCGVQLVFALLVIVLALRHGIGTAQVIVVVSWLIVSACAAFAFFTYVGVL